MARRLIIDVLVCQALINEQWSEHQVASGLMAEAEKYAQTLGIAALQNFCLCQQGIAKSKQMEDEIRFGGGGLNHERS